MAMDTEKAAASDEKLFAAVGRLTVTWAHLEFALDCMIAIIHGLMEGSRHEKALPKQLAERIKYLRRAFNRLGIPDADRPRYDKFLDDIEREAVTRHDIVHGFPIYHPSDSGEAQLVRLKIGKTKWDEHRQVTISIESVMASVDAAQALAGRGQTWVRTMLETYEQIHGPIPI